MTKQDKKASNVAYLRVELTDPPLQWMKKIMEVLSFGVNLTGYRNFQDLLEAEQRALKASEPAWITQLAKEIEQSDDSSILDNVVHDEFSGQASSINNGGVLEQVRFLAEKGWTESMIRAETELPAE